MTLARMHKQQCDSCRRAAPLTRVHIHVLLLTMLITTIFDLGGRAQRGGRTPAWSPSTFKTLDSVRLPQPCHPQSSGLAVAKGTMPYTTWRVAVQNLAVVCERPPTAILWCSKQLSVVFASRTTPIRGTDLYFSAAPSRSFLNDRTLLFFR
jgi:hypothetical protein